MEARAAGGGAGAEGASLSASLLPPPSSSSRQHPQQLRVGPSRMVDRTEYVRLLQQSLRGLGFGGAADALERESVRSWSMAKQTAARAPPVAGVVAPRSPCSSGLERTPPPPPKKTKLNSNTKK